MIVKQSCLAFGAYETAKKLSEDGEKLKILIDLLIEEDLNSIAYLISKNYLSEEELEEYNNDFQDVETENISRNKVGGQLHLSLTGETIADTKKRLRNMKRQVARERKKDQFEERETKKEEKKREIPTRNRDGLEYIKLEEFNFSRENFFFVPTPRSFAKVKDHFLEETTIGIDCEYFGHELSTITFASDKLVAVFDIVSLSKNKDIIQYIKDIILSPDIEIVAHTFRTDAFVLKEALGIDPYKIVNVLDLTEIVKEDGSDNRIGLQRMVQKTFDKALNQYYKRSNWESRPIDNQMIEYAALNAVIVLQIFLKFDKENPNVGIKYYDYDPPKGNPIMGRRAKAGKKKEKKKSRGGRGAGGRRNQSRRGRNDEEDGGDDSRRGRKGKSTRRSTKKRGRGGKRRGKGAGTGGRRQGGRRNRNEDRYEDDEGFDQGYNQNYDQGYDDGEYEKVDDRPYRRNRTKSRRGRGRRTTRGRGTGGRGAGGRTRRGGNKARGRRGAYSGS